MKRISVLAIAIFAVITATAQASIYHVATQYRARWSPYTHSFIWGDYKYSPYALKYGSSGMIHRRARYNPYAKKFGGTGLVNENVRYSPYAFGYNRSGLIADPRSVFYASYYARPIQYSRPKAIVRCNTRQPARSSGQRSEDAYNRAQNNYLAKEVARRAQMEDQKRRRSEIITKTEYNGRDIIAAYLNSKNIDFRINRILSIESKLISIDFQLTDKNIIIKYWNPEEILALKKQQNINLSFYEKYLESYKGFCSDYLDTGGKIYQIISADNLEVFSWLLECEELNEQDKSADNAVVAKAD